MQASMSALPSSGNPDHDFALNMRLHHGTASFSLLLNNVTY